MRDAFATELTNLSKERGDIVLLSGDIGNRMFDNFKKVSPNKFFNCGIAEANMMSMAAGMALSGLKPFVYTITPFTTTRCLEQIRIGVAYHEAPVTIVGTGSGLSYAELGPTHHSLEDIAIIRSIPGIRVLAPSDRNELISQLQDCVKNPCPTYIRIGKKGEPEIFNNDEHELGIAKANILKEGSDILLLGIGPIINEGLKAANELMNDNVSVSVASLGSVRPLDEKFLEIIKVPIEIGDTVLGGKFKNKKMVVKSIEKNEKGDITINKKPLLKFRITKQTESRTKKQKPLSSVDAYKQVRKPVMPKSRPMKNKKAYDRKDLKKGKYD